MPSDIVQERGGLRYRLTDPKALKTKVDGGGLRFTVVIEDAGSGIVLFKFFGFRLLGGKIYPPSRRDGYQWFPQAEISEPGLEALGRRLKGWEGEFKKVAFPE